MTNTPPTPSEAADGVAVCLTAAPSASDITFVRDSAAEYVRHDKDCPGLEGGDDWCSCGAVPMLAAIQSIVAAYAIDHADIAARLQAAEEWRRELCERLGFDCAAGNTWSVDAVVADVMKGEKHATDRATTAETQRDELRAELERVREGDARYALLRSLAVKKTAHDLYGNGAHWSIGMFSKDSRESFDETVGAARAAADGGR